MNRARNQHALNARLKGSTLAEKSKDDELSAKRWIRKQKRRAKERERELAQKRQKDMEEADQAVYDERDLEGLKVAHGADDFQEGEDVVLTLKDSRVLAGDGGYIHLILRDRLTPAEDELQNVNMMDDVALRAAKERKRKAQSAYTGYDDEEFDEDRIGRKADVLSKYDDEFSTGKAKSEGFRLGAAPVEKEMKVVDDEFETIGFAPAVKVKLNLEYTSE